jgi:hypothetical protein
MKKVSAVVALLILGLALPISPARADESPNASPTPALYDNGSTPAGNEKLEPEHRIRDDEHGFEAVQLSIVAGAIIIAIGIAVGIGRRRRD